MKQHPGQMACMPVGAPLSVPGDAPGVALRLVH